MSAPTATKLRGFAAMDPDKQREIAGKGGRAAHAKGTAHEWSTEQAVEAGRKGGRSVSRDAAHMAEIGRRGGQAMKGRTRMLGNSARHTVIDEVVTY